MTNVLPFGVVTNNAVAVSISGLFGGKFAGDGSALTNLPATGAGSGTAGNYVSAHDDAIGNGALASGQPEAISFSAITMNGWTCAGDNATFTCSQAGVYLFAITRSSSTMEETSESPLSTANRANWRQRKLFRQHGAVAVSQSFLASLTPATSFKFKPLPWAPRRSSWAGRFHGSRRQLDHHAGQALEPTQSAILKCSFIVEQIESARLETREA